MPPAARAALTPRPVTADSLNQLREKLAALKENKRGSVPAAPTDKENSPSSPHAAMPLTKSARAKPEDFDAAEAQAAEPPCAKSVETIGPVTAQLAQLAQLPAVSRTDGSGSDKATKVKRTGPVPRQAPAAACGSKHAKPAGPGRETMRREAERMQREIKALSASLMAAEDKAKAVLQEKQSLACRLKAEEGRCRELQLQLRDAPASGSARPQPNSASGTDGTVYVRLQAQQRKLQELEREREDRMQTQEQLQAELEACIELRVEEQDKHAEATTEFTNQLLAVRGELGSTQADLAAAKGTLQGLDTLQAQVAASEQARTQAQDEINNWRDKFHEEQEQLLRLSASVETMERDRAAAARAEASLRKRVHALTESVGDLQAMNARQAVECAETARKYADASSKLDRCGAQQVAAAIIQAAWGRRAARRLLHHCRRACTIKLTAALTAERAQSSNQLDDMKSKYDSACAELDKLQQSDMGRTLHSTVEGLQQLESELLLVVEERDALQIQLDETVPREQEAAANAYDELKLRCERAEQEAARLREVSLDKDQKIARLRAQQAMSKPMQHRHKAGTAKAKPVIGRRRSLACSSTPGKVPSTTTISATAVNARNATTTRQRRGSAPVTDSPRQYDEEAREQDCQGPEAGSQECNDTTSPGAAEAPQPEPVTIGGEIPRGGVRVRQPWVAASHRSSNNGCAVNSSSKTSQRRAKASGTGRRSSTTNVLLPTSSLGEFEELERQTLGQSALEESQPQATTPRSARAMLDRATHAVTVSSLKRRQSAAQMADLLAAPHESTSRNQTKSSRQRRNSSPASSVSYVF